MKKMQIAASNTILAATPTRPHTHKHVASCQHLIEESAGGEGNKGCGWGAWLD